MILIVDDFEDGAAAVCRLLSARGYPCAWVPSGPEALARIRAHPPEQPLLVVLDVMMPEMSGMEVLRAIRGEAKIAHTTVIMFTAGFDIAKRDEALTLGAVAWLMKGTADVVSVIKSIGEWYERIGGVAGGAPAREDGTSA